MTIKMLFLLIWSVAAIIYYLGGAVVITAILDMIGIPTFLSLMIAIYVLYTHPFAALVGYP